ncbi:hypothetical protein NQ314_006692 [Rhamnusium bicolor]|uniref:Uncharacterized protein n=1 Tax=Rhamnusium bicolor TaxID=1586634 RepID=A0AAV8YXM9_9CUCU|nr:hypothetical protein NQ314_006692 [Rhamnusium bicolor]
MCDRRMMEAEEERCNLIGKKWAPKQLIEMVNNYINAFQLELDRFVDSLLLLGDYYTGVVTKMPNDVVLKKEPLPKLDIEDEGIADAINYLLEIVEDVNDLNEDNLNKNNENENNTNENNLNEDIINENTNEKDTNENDIKNENVANGNNTNEINANGNKLFDLPFHQTVEGILNRALEFVQRNQDLANSTKEKLKVLFAPQTTKGKKKPPKKR